MRIRDWSSDVCSSDLCGAETLEQEHSIEIHRASDDGRNIAKGCGDFAPLHLSLPQGAGFAAAYIERQAGPCQRRSEGRRGGKEGGRAGRSGVCPASEKKDEVGK